jgi:hypothetical protein
VAKEKYQAPIVYDLTSGINDAHAANCLSGTSATGGSDNCGTGFAAGSKCQTGNSPVNTCTTGVNPGAGPSKCWSGADAAAQCKTGGLASTQCQAGAFA